jgi:hypothetical protein
MKGRTTTVRNIIPIIDASLSPKDKLDSITFTIDQRNKVPTTV